MTLFNRLHACLLSSSSSDAFEEEFAALLSGHVHDTTAAAAAADAADAAPAAPAAGELSRTTLDAAKLFLQGNFVSVLKSTCNTWWLQSTTKLSNAHSLDAIPGQQQQQGEAQLSSSDLDELAAQWTQRSTQASPSPSTNTEKSLAQLTHTIIAASCLNLFVQVNWTGPSLAPNPKLAPGVPGLAPAASEKTRDDELRVLSSFVPEQLLQAKNAHDVLLEALTVDGEEPYKGIAHPVLFWMAKTLLARGLDAFDSCPTPLGWWNLRAARVHQQLLSENANTLFVTTQELIQKVAKDEAFLSLDGFADLKPNFQLECGMSYHMYGETAQAKSCFAEAQKLTGLQMNLSGALGKRTRFQAFDTAQLVLQATSAPSTSGSASASNGSQSSIPVQLKLNDDTLLEEVKLTESDETVVRNLRVIDQCIILATCLNVKNSNPNHGLVTEEMFPYVTRVLANPNNWMVHTFGLLIRSRLETEKSRTVERAALQLQALVDQFNDPESDAKVSVRMEHFYSLDVPPIWSLKRELGGRYKALGVLRTALDIFEALQMWEEVVDCYRLLEKNKQAEQIILEQISIRPSPKLYCLLGDVTSSAEHYIQAWEMSKHKYPRAMRGLGYLYLRQEKLAECADCFEKALNINPILHGVWFSLGCVHLRLEMHEKAVHDFRRVVSLQPDDAESWNNLATAYIKLKEKERAFNALEEALKEKWDSWRVWENLLFVAVDIADFEAAIRALNRLMDLRDKYLDIQILDIIVRAAVDNVEDRFGNKVGRLQKQVAELLGRTTSMITNNQDVWTVYARFNEGFGNKEKGLDCRLKAYRAAQKAGWEKDPSLFPGVAEAAKLLANAYLAEGSKKSLHSARLALSGLTKKAEDSFHATDDFAQLKALLAQAVEAEASAAV